MDAHERRNDLQRALLDINQRRQQENCELAAQGDQQLPAALQSDRKRSAFVLSGHESDLKFLDVFEGESETACVACKSR